MQGQRIFVDINNLKHTNEQACCAHAHRLENRICFNSKFIKTELSMVQLFDSWSFSMLHEVSHMFDYGAGDGNMLWNAESESLATFKMVCAMQLLDAYVIEHEVTNSKSLNKLDGDGLQKLIIDTALQKHHNNDLPAFSSGGRSSFSAFDLSLHSLTQQYIKSGKREIGRAHV